MGSNLGEGVCRWAREILRAEGGIGHVADWITRTEETDQASSESQVLVFAVTA